MRFNAKTIGEKTRFFLIFIAACAIFLFISWWAAFAVTYNDFWGILFYARHLSWQGKASLYNGFYPIGYALLLRLLPYGYVVQGITIINAMFGGVLSATVTQLVRKMGSAWIALLVFGLSILYPLLFEHAISVAPEIGCAGFTAIAIFILWKNNDSPTAKRNTALWFFLAGLSLGSSTLWRNHTIVSSSTILFSYLVVVRGVPVKAKISLLTGFIVIFSFQMIINVISGHGLLETAQNFNLYKLFNPIDWRNMPPLNVVASFSIVSTFLSNPRLVLSVYIPAFFKVAIYALPALLGLLSFPKSKYRSFWLFAAWSILLYSIIVAFGSSRRAPLVMASPALLSVGFLIGAIGNYFRQKSSHAETMFRAAMSVFYILILAWFAWIDLDLINLLKARDKTMQGLENVLLRAGMKSPDEVFADDFDIYLPGLPPYSPRIAGGWNDDYLWGYTERYPKLPFASAAAFDAATHEQGIRFLVLSPNSKFFANFLYTLYMDEKSISLPSFEFIRNSRGYKVFKRITVP